MIFPKTLSVPHCPAAEPESKAHYRGISLLYFIAASLILGIKYWYARAGSSDLEWILLPTARWAELLSGIPFEKAPQIGYINHSLRFIIAPSCSGVQFMLIAFATLCFPFLHRIGTVKKGFCLIASALAAAFLYTVAVNGFRIVLSICLPPLLMDGLRKLPCGNCFSAEKLHTLIGTAVYFTALLLLYRGADALFRRAQALLCKAGTPFCKAGTLLCETEASFRKAKKPLCNAKNHTREAQALLCLADYHCNTDSPEETQRLLSGMMTGIQQHGSHTIHGIHAVHDSHTVRSIHAVHSSHTVRNIHAVHSSHMTAGIFRRYLPPVLCYFSVTLGIPFLCRIYRNSWEHFPDYAMLVTAICLTVLLCFGLSDAILRQIGSRFGKHKSQVPHHPIPQETDTHEN